jgi:peroxiredoxin Q/BCP
MPTTTAEKITASPIAEGSAAPACNLPITGGKTVAIDSFKGKKNVVLYFYPKDDTPGCTLEAKDFRDLKAEFDNADTVVIGISKDDMKSHEKFSSKYELSFPLASDAESDVCERYGVWGEKNMYGKKYMGITRATFLIDKKGMIAKTWPKVSVPEHAKEVLAAAKAL